MGLIIWLGETIFGVAIKGLLSRFFPSPEIRLGTAEQKVIDETIELYDVQERQKIDQSVGNLSDADAARRLSKWRRER